MDPALHPLEKYLVHQIVIIDTDEPEVDLLARILSNPPHAVGTVSSHTIIVGTLAEAEPYMQRGTPTIAVIDPAIDAASTILDFISSVRKAYLNVVWLINTEVDWWSANVQLLASHPFGERLKRYYRRDKRPQTADPRDSFLDVLNLCRNDLLLDLITKSADDISAAKDRIVTRNQVEKFAAKLVLPAFSLFVEEHGSQARTKRALVSIDDDPEQRRRYQTIIAPTLENAGYTSMTIQHQLSAVQLSTMLPSALQSASLFVADLTEFRSIVFEIGAAVATRIPVVFVAHGSKLPADKLQIPAAASVIECNTDAGLREKLNDVIRTFPRQ